MNTTSKQQLPPRRKKNIGVSCVFLVNKLR